MIARAAPASLARVLAAAALLAAVALSSASPAAADPAPPPAAGYTFGVPTQGGPPSSTAELTDTASSGSTHPGLPAQPAANSDSSGRRYEYRTVPLQGPCPVTPTELHPQLLSYEHRLLPDGKWQAYGNGCTGNPAAPAQAAAPVLDLEDLRRTALTVRATVRPALPQLAVQPSGGALVNQPAIFYLADPGAPPTAGATNPLSGRQVTVTLSAPAYDWDFGDGTGRSHLAGRGQPYSPSSAVPTEGDGNPWVSHTYRRPASLTVRATATYQASYTYTGNPAGPLPLEPLVVDDTAPVTVRSAHTQLVDH